MRGPGFNLLRSTASGKSWKFAARLVAMKVMAGFAAPKCKSVAQRRQHGARLVCSPASWNPIFKPENKDMGKPAFRSWEEIAERQRLWEAVEQSEKALREATTRDAVRGYSAGRTSALGRVHTGLIRPPRIRYRTRTPFSWPYLAWRQGSSRRADLQSISRLPLSNGIPGRSP